MRKDAGVDGDAQRINQLVWMFFLKIFDDRESEKELLEENYRSPMPEHLRWRNGYSLPHVADVATEVSPIEGRVRRRLPRRHAGERGCFCGDDQRQVPALP